jgi:hypothetical protein
MALLVLGVGVGEGEGASCNAYLGLTDPKNRDFSLFLA